MNTSWKQKIAGKTLFLQRFLVYFSNHFVSRVFVSWFRLFWYRSAMRYRIGRDSSILTGFKVARHGNISIGKNSVINNNCKFDNRFPITIGNNVSISYGSIIFTKGHDIDDPKFPTIGASVYIDDYVWLASKVIILPGVSVGEGAVVLTGSVVSKDVEPFNVVGGNPAKFIRLRPSNQSYQLKFNPWVPFFG